MKQVAFILTLFLFFSTACTEQVNEKEVQLVDLSTQNMKIIPVNPTSSDMIRLVVFDDCTYNVLSGVTRNDKTIEIRKQFNSMMKWPCMIKNDTILIGKLPEGTYRVNYSLIDVSQQTPPNSTLSFTFQLEISK
jgi:hypothetical protein